jgi:hypothetical protein
MHDHDDLHDAGLARIADQLRAHRPQLTALELDEVGRRVRARVAAPPARRRTRSSFMKSRLAILSMLVAGLLFSGTGGALAISGFTSSASVAQYGGDQGQNDNGDNGDNGGNGGNGGVKGQSAGGAGTQSPTGDNASGLQPTQQVEAGATGSSGQLPFTGYAAIPVLLGGIALLSAGLIIRRRAHDEL